MAISTRNTARLTTPISDLNGKEADTIRKSRFFEAYDRRGPNETISQIGHQFGLETPTSKKYLKARKDYGTAAYRRTRPRSTKLGRRPKVSDERIRMLVDHTQNPVRHLPLDRQIAHHQLGISVRTLQRRLRQVTRNAQMFKPVIINKKISTRNKGKREEYGQEHQEKTVDNFWRFVFFTDEAHINPNKQSSGRLLREEGTRYNDENIVEVPDQDAATSFHMAGWCNWEEKCEELIFYNDEVPLQHQVQADRPPKPRRSKYHMPGEYERLIEEWEAAFPPPVEVKTKGNSMNEKYYVDKILPVYIEAIQTFQWQDPMSRWILQEDGDPSHGIRSEGLAFHTKQRAGIVNLVHPAQSPDLNPQEACWNILKQRVRQRIWVTRDDLKAVIQEEWRAIRMEEVRARIAEMPDRCKRVARNGGKAVKSALW
jgi:hypothetical protein